MAASTTRRTLDDATQGSMSPVRQLVLLALLLAPGAESLPLVRTGATTFSRSRRILLRQEPSWFPPGSDEASIRLRFKELARTMHPDSVSGSVEDFQLLQAEYERKLSECRTDSQRATLQKGWLGIMAAATAITVTAAELGAGLTAAEWAAGAALVAAFAAANGDPAEVDEREPHLTDMSVSELYARLDECIESEDYEEGQRVKACIEARKAG